MSVCKMCRRASQSVICDECANALLEKLDREKMAEVFRRCDGIDVYSPEALADKMIRYLTE